MLLTVVERDMSWPVQIIPPGDKVPEIKWMKWFFSFLCGLAVAGVSWGGARIIAPAAESELSKLFIFLFFLWLCVYSIILFVRIYYYGVCLSVFEAKKREAELVREIWTEWASKKINVPICNLFLPSVISKIDITASHFIEIYSEQKLKLRDHNEEVYTEEQLIYELLASVRSTLISLRKSCVFDVIFTYGSSNITFATFKECWAAIGFPDDCLDNYYYWDGTLEQKFDMLSNIEAKRVLIIISANIESIEGYYTDATEFASILLVTNPDQLLSNENTGVALRTMACSKTLAKQEFIHMVTYQPDVLKTSKVLFSNMSVNDVQNVSDVLRTTCLSINVGWEYEAQYLDLKLGKLDDYHFWLVFALAFFISEKNNEPILMVACIGDEYVFNVIKPFDNSKEH